MNNTIRRRSLGEGYFLRALYYFHLVRLFGDVPLYTNVITAEESATITRAPKADVYAQIIEDLKTADTLLPNTYSADDKGRATAGAAKGLLASVYLTIGDMNNAAQKAKEVIDNRALYGYDLWQDYADNFKLDNENGKESLFEVQYRSGGGTFSIYSAGSCINTFYGPRAQMWCANPATDSPFQPKTLLTSMKNRDCVQYHYRQAQRQNHLDPRRYVRNLYTTCTVGWFSARIQYQKYFIPIDNTTGDDGQWRSALNIPIMRYAEVLLIYAEAAGPALGKPYIDQVRDRAGLDPLPGNLSATQYQEAVYKERRLELGFEMHRWYDLLRHPDPNYFINVMRAAGKTNIQAKHRYMPIPQAERDKNANLTQNEGY